MAHLSVEVEFDSEHFQSSMLKLELSTEDEFLSETRIGLFSSSNEGIVTFPMMYLNS